MKKQLLLLAGLLSSVAAHSQTTWTQVWSDEFNGPTLDQTKWTYETGTGVNGDFGTGQLDRATDRPENVAIERGILGADGGALRISTRKETYQDRNYTSGRINTKDKAFWGPNHRIVARVWPKGVRTQGQGFAFWMMGNEHPANVQELTWPQLGEIDIMEYVGAIPNYNLGTVHYAYYYNNNQYQEGNHGQHGAYYSFAEKQTPDPTESIRLDLGAIYSLNRVNLIWENGNKNVRNYAIETSLDGTTWNPVYNTTSGDGGTDDLSFGAVNARFVRMRGTGRLDDYGYSLLEFQVFAAGSPTNLALASKASATSAQAPDLAANFAIDGQTSTRWGSGLRNPQYQSNAVASTTDPNGGNNGWHDYGIDWFSDRMEFFVDNNVYHIHYFNDGGAFGKVDGQNEEGLAVVNGKKVKKSEYSNLYDEWHPFEHKMYAILSAGVGGGPYTYGGAVQGQPAEFPADVYIDWVRVYSNGQAFNPPPTVTITAPTGTDTYPAPGRVTLTATAADREGGTISKVDFYQGTTLLGTATAAPYTFVWANVPAGNYAVTAKATDNGGATATSKAVNVAVNGPNSNLALNRPGTASSTTGSYRADLAFDADPTTKWESLYASATENISVDLGATYAINRVKILWEAALATDYEIRLSANGTTWGAPIKTVTGNDATLNDLTGLSGSGRYVGIFGLKKKLTTYGYSIYNVEVYGPGGGGNPGNAAPTVSLTAPAANAAFTAPAALTLAATAADADGTISKVDFYQGATLLGTDTSAPYSYSWANVAAGTYSLTAKATDNGGATTTSAAVTVTVGPTPPATTGDLARGKPAKASSVWAGNEPGLAVDGDPKNTRWESNRTDNEWIYVDLGATYNVNRVNITWENALGRDYQVQVGSPTTTWTTIKDVAGNTTRFNDLTGLSGSGQFVRILGLKRGTGYGYSIYQLEVYGTAGPTPPVAGGKAIPGKIEAEAFDAQSGTQTEPTADAGGGLNVGYLDAGDYLDYDVAIASNSNYTVQFRIASWIDAAQLQLLWVTGLEGNAVKATVTLPNTGGGQNWQTVTVNNVSLPVGNNRLRVKALTNGFNFNWMNFSLASATAARQSALATQAEVAVNNTISGYPNPADQTFYLEGVADGTAVVVTGITGNKVATLTVSQGTLDVHGLASGLYLLRIADGAQTRQLKMLKK